VDPERALVLSVLVWEEPGTASGMRARVRSAVDLTRPSEAGGYVSAPDELYAAVRDAVERFLHPPPVIQLPRLAAPPLAAAPEDRRAAPTARSPAPVGGLAAARPGRTPVPITHSEVRALVSEWFRMRDRHAPVADMRPLLMADVEMRLLAPEAIIRRHQGFECWYERIVRRFFDESHETTTLDLAVCQDTADVTLSVTWQRRAWEPPEPHSERCGFAARERWTIVRDRDDGRAKISSYVVDALAPLPRS
jgi:hypothetical protein